MRQQGGNDTADMAHFYQVSLNECKSMWTARLKSSGKYMYHLT